MFDCIYTAHCIRDVCDLACQVHTEIQYWMERCDIKINNPILHCDDSKIAKAQQLIESNTGKLVTVKSKDTAEFGDILSYVAICLHGRGTALTHGIYKLNFSEFMDEIKHSWQTHSDSNKLEFMKIWANSENYLIIVGLDYIKFGDFESQTLLQLIQSRRSPEKSTFVVIPESESLVGANNSIFFTRLMDVLEEAKPQ